jgi:predicted RNase H-like HicB family nuclease
MTSYPARIEPNDDGWLVTFRDIESAHTWVSNRDIAEAAASEVLAATLEQRSKMGMSTAVPSQPIDGEIMISSNLTNQS